MDRFLGEDGGIFKGPYLSIKLPYRTSLGRTFAYLLEGNRVRETPVRAGSTFGDMVEIHPLPFYGKSGVLAKNRGKRGA
jgi:hypothetical protein